MYIFSPFSLCVSKQHGLPVEAGPELQLLAVWHALGTKVAPCPVDILHNQAKAVGSNKVAQWTITYKQRILSNHLKEGATARPTNIEYALYSIRSTQIKQRISQYEYQYQ